MGGFRQMLLGTLKRGITEGRGVCACGYMYVAGGEEAETRKGWL